MDSSPPLVAGSAAVVVGILAGALYLQGTFYPVDAFGITALALGLVAAGVAWNRDRHGASVVLTVGGLATWWFVRSLEVHSPAAFLPFGASLLAFLAGFLVLRALADRDRARSAPALVAVGAVLAASGVVGVLGRWTVLARPVAGSWHAASTLTDPAATAVVCAVVVLLALANDLRLPRRPRRPGRRGRRPARRPGPLGTACPRRRGPGRSAGPLGDRPVAAGLWCGLRSRRRRHVDRSQRRPGRLGGRDRGPRDRRRAGAGTRRPLGTGCRRGRRRGPCHGSHPGRPAPAHRRPPSTDGDESDRRLVQRRSTRGGPPHSRASARPGCTPRAGRSPTTRASNPTPTCRRRLTVVRSPRCCSSWPVRPWPRRSDGATC